jgi:hypothetical protein
MRPPCQITMLVAWRRRLFRNLWLSLFSGVAVTAVYERLLYTTIPHLFKFAVIAWGPAVEFIARWHPNCHSPLRCKLEIDAANVVIYAFWAFVLLVGIDLLRQLKRTEQ